MFMNFDISPENRAHIKTILDRLEAILPGIDRESRSMDLIACHNGGCPLDFAAMANFADFSQVAHDVTGIGRYLNRETGELGDHFAPRFALPEQIQPGEKVSYTTVTPSGRHGLKFSSREGTLVEIRGVNAQVKAKNGRLLWVESSDLRRFGQQNALTEAFVRMAEALEKQPIEG
jgi:hypothetical protein